MRGVGLHLLRERGVTDEWIAQHGGTFSKSRLNVIFRAGPEYDKVSELLTLPPMPKRPTREEEIAAWLRANGPRLWANFHTELLTIELSREVVESFMLNKIIGPLRCSTRCKPSAKKLLTRMPPIVASRRELLDWGYDYHDEVNEHAGHPRIGRDAARAIRESSSETVGD